MAEHEHDFGPVKAKGTVGFCRVAECTELRVVDHKKLVWRELTSTEQTNVTIRMWADTILVQAMQIVHGEKRGLARYRYLRGYSDSEG